MRELIETNRLTIRKIIQDDGPAFIEMAKDGSLFDCGLDCDCAKWMNEWTANANKFSIRYDPTQDWIAYAIVLKDEGKVIGSVGCSYYDDLDKVGIVYFIGAEYRGKGYALEAIHSYLEFFFENYSVDEMIATIRENNIASWKTLEKTRFELADKRLYQDFFDDKPELYRFYVAKR